MSGTRGRHLTLLVPGLRGPGPAGGHWWEGLALPALSRFLTRADPVAPLCAEAGLSAMIFESFGVARDTPDWPVAPVTACLDGESAEAGWWLRADPVHLRVDRGELVLVDTAAIGVTAEEARRLVAAVNSELDEAAPRVRAPAAERWYVRLEAPPDLATRAPWDVSGGVIGEHLPRGGDAGPWRAWVNDIQMILHGCSVNRERERRGAPAINSVWPWGGGALPRVPGGRWQTVTADNPLAIGLGALANAAPGAAAGDARAWLAGDRPPGEHLLLSDGGYVPLRLADAHAWRDSVCRLERDWVAPLLAALGSGAVESLRLCPGGGADYRLGRAGLRRWWRRRRPPARLLAPGR